MAAHREIGGLARASCALLLIQATLAALAVVLVALRGAGADDPIYATVALLQALIFVVGGICVLVWIYRAKANTVADGARDLSFSPAMAVASYFIPVFNLVMPLQAMRELYRASVDPRDWEAVGVPAIFALWWTFWIAGNVTGIAAWRLSELEGREAPPDVLGWLFVASDAGTVLASLLLMRIVVTVTALQRQRAVFAA